MRDLTSCNQPLLNVKRKLRRNTPRELRKLDLRRLRIRREHSLRSRERESRSFVRCTKPERT
jgi:hypothetical protein